MIGPMRVAIDLLRLGRIVPCIDACAAIAAGVDAKDSAALLLVACIARCSVEQSALQ
jgi:hypothetical protein